MPWRVGDDLARRALTRPSLSIGLITSLPWGIGGDQPASGAVSRRVGHRGVERRVAEVREAPAHRVDPKARGGERLAAQRDMEKTAVGVERHRHAGRRRLAAAGDRHPLDKVEIAARPVHRQDVHLGAGGIGDIDDRFGGALSHGAYRWSFTRAALIYGRSAQRFSQSAALGTWPKSIRAGRAHDKMLATLRSATVKCSPSR